jgi:L-asparaginase II
MSILLEAHRGELLESFHRGSICIQNSSGEILLDIGNAKDRLVFPRSALKPLQTAQLIHTGAYDAFKLTPQHLAFAASSHSGELKHVEFAQAWLDHLGLSLDDFECGVHAPMNPKSNQALMCSHTQPTVLHNACSGKHLGFLTSALHLGLPIKGYTQPDYPLQQQMINYIESLIGGPIIQNPKGIDGCSLPLCSMTLYQFGRALSHFINPSDPALKNIYRAMTTYPFMVGGTNQPSTVLMEASRGDALVKFAAGGGYGAVIPQKDLIITVKIDDGFVKAADKVIAGILNEAGVLKDKTNIQGLLDSPIKNYQGLNVGRWELSSSLRETLFKI